MTFANHFYALFGAPRLWRTFADDRKIVRYTFGNVVKECHAIVRDVRVEFLPDDDGTLVKRVLGQLVIGRDELAITGGIDDPQLKATFEIEDEYGEFSRWSVATSPDGNAIESKSDSFIVINIQQTQAAARAQRGYRDIRG